MIFLLVENLKHLGMYNKPDNLLNLDSNGDLIYQIDFKNFYASLLKEWLQTEPSSILNRKFKTLELV